MSYYYNYYVGYRKDGKFYPLGPYDRFGKIKSVMSLSRSFASDLHEEFWPITEAQISDELRKEFEYEDLNGNRLVHVKYLNVENLPDNNFIKTGYFLIEDVQRYEKAKAYNATWDFDGFYDHIDPITYVAMLQNERMLGRPQPQKDEFGEEYTPHSVADYMFYAYPDFYSKEYEASILRKAVSSLESYSVKELEGVTYVILETEG